ncbi:hypothetical protein D3C83_68800 [compost metagenome]
MTSHDPDFWEKPADLCDLYLNPAENAVAVPRIPVRREFEYRRNGTAVLYAALDVHEDDLVA